MNLKEIARELDVSPRTLSRWMKKKNIVISGRMGYCLTPKQVMKLYKEFGKPESMRQIGKMKNAKLRQLRTKQDKWRQRLDKRMKR